MIFTDDDLKRLKELNAKLDLEEEISEDVALWILNSQPALLARLEKSEKKGAAADRLRAFRGMQPEYEAFDKADEAWRKAAGK